MSKSVFTSEQVKEIGEQLGIDWSKFDVEQFKFPDYYTRLAKMEQEGEAGL